MPEVFTGTVKFFDASKGFGFITPNDGGKDVFVHKTAAPRGGLRQGQNVQFEITTQRGKPAAANVIAA